MLQCALVLDVRSMYSSSGLTVWGFLNGFTRGFVRHLQHEATPMSYGVLLWHPWPQRLQSAGKQSAWSQSVTIMRKNLTLTCVRDDCTSQNTSWGDSLPASHHVPCAPRF